MIDFGKVIRSEWGSYITEISFAFGSAARGNRGRYAGSHVHVLRVEKIVGIKPDADPRDIGPNTLGARFVATGRPVTFSTHPLCNCTSGQHAGQASSSLSAADVTCEKCRARMGA